MLILNITLDYGLVESFVHHRYEVDEGMGGGWGNLNFESLHFSNGKAAPISGRIWKLNWSERLNSSERLIGLEK